MRDPLPRRAVLNGSTSRRACLALAANYAGIGFGNAGVHPHAVAYPITGLVRDYVPDGCRTGTRSSRTACR